MRHKLFQSKKAQALKQKKNVSGLNMGSFQEKKDFFLPFLIKALLLIFLFISCSVVFIPSCMQMFFCFAVIISVSVLADAIIASFCTNFPKEFAILGKQLFIPALCAFRIISMHGQSHTKVSLAEKKSYTKLYISSVEQAC